MTANFVAGLGLAMLLAIGGSQGKKWPIFVIHCPAKSWIYLTPYVCSERILTADCSCTTKYFEKTLIEVDSSHLYASFGTFWVQIGQLVEAQWDFKLSEEFEINVIFLRKRRFCRFHTFFKDRRLFMRWWCQRFLWTFSIGTHLYPYSADDFV